MSDNQLLPMQTTDGWHKIAELTCQMQWKRERSDVDLGDTPELVGSQWLAGKLMRWNIKKK